jgi:hypothetical protein
VLEFLASDGGTQRVVELRVSRVGAEKHAKVGLALREQSRGDLDIPDAIVVNDLRKK